MKKKSFYLSIVALVITSILLVMSAYAFFMSVVTLAGNRDNFTSDPLLNDAYMVESDYELRKYTNPEYYNDPSYVSKINDRLYIKIGGNFVLEDDVIFTTDIYLDLNGFEIDLKGFDIILAHGYSGTSVITDNSSGGLIKNTSASSSYLRLFTPNSSVMVKGGITNNVTTINGSQSTATPNYTGLDNVIITMASKFITPYAYYDNAGSKIKYYAMAGSHIEFPLHVFNFDVTLGWTDSEEVISEYGMVSNVTDTTDTVLTMTAKSTAFGLDFSHNFDITVFPKNTDFIDMCLDNTEALFSDYYLDQVNHTTTDYYVLERNLLLPLVSDNFWGSNYGITVSYEITNILNPYSDEYYTENELPIPVTNATDYLRDGRILTPCTKGGTFVLKITGSTGSSTVSREFNFRAWAINNYDEAYQIMDNAITNEEKKLLPIMIKSELDELVLPAAADYKFNYLQSIDYSIWDNNDGTLKSSIYYDVKVEEGIPYLYVISDDGLPASDKDIKMKVDMKFYTGKVTEITYYYRVYKGIFSASDGSGVDNDTYIFNAINEIYLLKCPDGETLVDIEMPTLFLEPGSILHETEIGYRVFAYDLVPDDFNFDESSVDVSGMTTAEAEEAIALAKSEAYAEKFITIVDNGDDTVTLKINRAIMNQHDMRIKLMLVFIESDGAEERLYDSRYSLLTLPGIVWNDTDTTHYNIADSSLFGAIMNSYIPTIDTMACYYDVPENPSAYILYRWLTASKDSFTYAGNAVSYKGIEYLTGTKRFDYSGSNITLGDLTTYMSNYTIIEELIIENGTGFGVDVNTFPILPSLRKLDLSGNNIYGISGLKSLYYLKELDLSNNALADFGTNKTDLTTFKYLGSLEVLRINDNRISYFNFLEEITSIEAIYVYNNEASVSDANAKLLLGSNSDNARMFFAYYVGNVSHIKIYNDASDLTEYILYGRDFDEADWIMAKRLYSMFVTNNKPYKTNEWMLLPYINNIGQNDSYAIDWYTSNKTQITGVDNGDSRHYKYTFSTTGENHLVAEIPVACLSGYVVKYYRLFYVEVTA